MAHLFEALFFCQFLQAKDQCNDFAMVQINLINFDTKYSSISTENNHNIAVKIAINEIYNIDYG
jgi:hypothetical protein